MYEVDTDTFKRKLTTSGALKKLDILYNQLYRNKNTQIYITDSSISILYRGKYIGVQYGGRDIILNDNIVFSSVMLYSILFFGFWESDNKFTFSFFINNCTILEICISDLNIKLRYRNTSFYFYDDIKSEVFNIVCPMISESQFLKIILMT